MFGSRWIDSPGLAALLRVLDVGIVGPGLWVASVLHGAGWEPEQAFAATSASCLFLLIGEHRGLYNSWRSLDARGHVLRVASVWAVMVLCLAMLAFLTHSSDTFSRRVVVSWFMVGTPLMLLLHGLVHTLAPAIRARTASRHVAIAGAGRLGWQLCKTLTDPAFAGLHVVGHFDDREQPREETRTEHVERHGDFAELVGRAARGEIDVVYVALPLRAEHRIRALVGRLAPTRVTVQLVADLGNFAPLRTRTRTQSLGPLSTSGLIDDPLGAGGRLLKRAEDLALACLLLVAAGPPMVAIGVAIRLLYGGPVVFKQRRYGLDGRKIVIWKFRTLVACDSNAQFQQVKRGDARVMRLGAVLRASSLDELPQLFNVIRGDMSLVGPRPHPLPLDDHHRDQIDWYALRHRVKPGITGWAQINGFRGETSREGAMAGRIQHDLEYIRNWSVGFDLKILALTLLRGWTGENAC